MSIRYDCSFIDCEGKDGDDAADALQRHLNEKLLDVVAIIPYCARYSLPDDSGLQDFHYADNGFMVILKGKVLKE